MIFISHQHSDKEFIGEIAEMLKNLYGEEKVFYDDWSIKPGENIINEMNTGLEKCKYFLFFISEKSLKSEMVNMEWTSALIKKSKEKIKFMPIRAENVDVPMIMSSIKYLDLYTMGMETIKTQIVDIISGYENNDRYATYQNIHAYALVTKINEVKFFLVAKKFFEPNGKFVVATTLNEKEASFTCSNFMYTHGFNPNVIEIDGKEHNAFLIDIPEGIKKGFKVETTFSSKFDRYENIRLLHLISDKKLANVEIIKINKESDIPNL